MSGEATQQELVWITPEEYESSVEGEKASLENMQIDSDHVDLPGSDLPTLLIANGKC